MDETDDLKLAMDEMIAGLTEGKPFDYYTGGIMRHTNNSRDLKYVSKRFRDHCQAHQVSHAVVEKIVEFLFSMEIGFMVLGI